MTKNKTTEEKIKEVSRRLFQEKGYGMTRTKEIAEAANINAALLHYYFKSKENLYKVIMTESIHDIFSILIVIINNNETTLFEKTEIIITDYTDFFMKNPRLPLFVLNEIQYNRPGKLIEDAGFRDSFLTNSILYKQVEVQIEEEKIDIPPLHLILNILSLILMPVIAKPLFYHIYNFQDDEYEGFIMERKKYILDLAISLFTNNLKEN